MPGEDENDTYTQIADQVERQIRRMANIGAADDEFTRSTHLFDFGYLDSFSAAELVSFVERTFLIVVPNADLANRALNTVDEISTYVYEKTSKETQK